MTTTNCQVCDGVGVLMRIYAGTGIEKVTCPHCVRGISVLGAHELLRPLVARGYFIEPGTILDRYTREELAVEIQ